MSNGSPATDPAHGYLSEQSKRRFTAVAGILGAVFFVAQVLLPMLVMFMAMGPMMLGSELSIADLDTATLWRNELWFMERTTKVSVRDPKSSASRLTLRHVHLADLSDAGPALALDAAAIDSSPALLPIGDRLWVIGADTVSYYEGGALTRLGRARRPARASRPFVCQGLPAVISRGTHVQLAALHENGGKAEWTPEELPLGLASEAGSLRSLQAVEANGRLWLFAELCMEEPERCSLSYREAENWVSLVEDTGWGASWTALELGSRVAVVLSDRDEGGTKGLSVVTVTPSGPQRQHVDLEGGRMAWSRWRALSLDTRLVVVSEGMPGSLRLAEVAEGRVVRSARTRGSFPFGPDMLLFMMIPQFLPILLSLVLALVLTAQMRRHRVQDYMFGGQTRRFASLWQRALAQLVDIVPFAVGFAVPMAALWRLFSDPETLIEAGASFPFLLFGLFIAAFVWALLVLVVFSYLEGRFGRTPGKWLLGIRVLGTNLQPCGFGRAFLRNLLTFVDGFFNFLVGALLVALTDNWQRLGDLAARTIVVVDEKPA
jgi:uncharacterized RDD family membrane protein YckC/uncharacterized protein YndB with AHSA1/START domain